MCYIASCVYPDTEGYVCGMGRCWYEESSFKSDEFGCWLCLHIRLTLCCGRQESTSFRQIPVEKGLTPGPASWCCKTRWGFLPKKNWDPPLPTKQVGWHMAQAAMKTVSSFKVASQVVQQAIAFAELWAGADCWFSERLSPALDPESPWERASPHKICIQRAKIYKWHQMIHHLKKGKKVWIVCRLTWYSLKLWIFR